MLGAAERAQADRWGGNLALPMRVQPWARYVAGPRGPLFKQKKEIAMKVVVAVVLGAVLGALMGAGFMHQKLMPALEEATGKLRETEQKLASTQSATESEAEKLARLEAERAQYSERLAALQARLDAKVNDAPAAAETDSADAEPLDPVTSEAEGDGAAADTNAPTEPGRERGNRGDRWGGTPEEREARRQEFATRMQENMSNFFTGELEKSSTPEMQARLVALEEKTLEMMDLRSQMRDAATDEERQALGEAFGETMAAAREIMQEQQGDMLGAIASQFGISKESDQVAFEQAVRAAMDSPFFSDNPGALLWSAGRQSDEGGGPVRGFGGGGFGGGRPGR